MINLQTFNWVGRIGDRYDNWFSTDNITITIR